MGARPATMTPFLYPVAYPPFLRFETGATMHLDDPDEAFDVAGRSIDVLIDRELDAGSQVFEWRPGAKTASGIYYLRVHGSEEARRVVLVR